MTSGLDDHGKEQKPQMEGATVYDFAPQRQLKAVHIEEFLAKKLPPREMVLNPIIPTQGLVMAYGWRGLGKTLLALGMGYAVASGGKFLRWEAPCARRVLFVDGEMPAVVLQERIAALIAANDRRPPEPDYLQIITPDLQDQTIPDLSTPEGQAAIEEHLGFDDESGLVELLILDNLSTLCRGGRENEAESWLPVQEWALSLRKRGVSVLFVHHSGKSGQQRGTSRKEDVLDTVVVLRRPGDYESSQGARFEVHFEKSRGAYGDVVKSFEAKLQTEQGVAVWTTKDLEESLTEQVANLLNDGVPQNEIAELLGYAKGTVSKHAKKARATGLVLDEKCT